ncbi:HAMP domain-containing histidine kinase [Solirubrobacter ginsenosidimutans]|uniref:histidine kinase n=1 Tax=Solirubrobacter ginsenosidimutans TaxID=490573 RepID=A0A9X3MYI0_9ACTN|nr:HAMP domain-containing sensor histidine kinase [Solirubrobacter ginsenosidimutans]MDA0165109.1 HAMP domain-containing histidine kinase [Solirubrobacter ginsenosidimutans]
MRTRLLGLVGGLMAVVLLALGVPLGIDLASVRTQRVFLDRLNDANRFVQVAQQQGDRSVLAAKLARYEEVYGIVVAVLDHSGRVRAASRPGLRAQSLTAPAQRLATVALSGHHGEPPHAIWPWTGAPLVVAQPVINGGDVVGAVVTLSPTDRLRRSVARAWLVVILGELIAVIGCALLASRLTRWILRPVLDLDLTAHEIATGRMAARALDGSGPPELRRLTGSFNVMAANVERIVERQRNFLADASHQLRNPLSALLLRLDSLSLRAPDGCEAEVDAAASEGRHLAGILERLLHLAQAEEADPLPERIDLAPIVERRIEAWWPAAHAKGMTIGRSGDAHVEAIADPVALSSALDVVLDNAVKFGPAGSTVRVSVEHAADGALVAVRDEGPGLGPDELCRASDRFWRGRRHQNVDGSGLGLAIARTLLEQSGARLELRTLQPRGLEASLRFGVAEPAQRGGV